MLLALATLNGWVKDDKASEKEALKSAAANVSELRETLRSEEGATPVAMENLRNLDRDDPKAKYFKAEFKRVLREIEVERDEQVEGGEEQDNGGDELDERKESTKTEHSEADGDN